MNIKRSIAVAACFGVRSKAMNPHAREPRKISGPARAGILVLLTVLMIVGIRPGLADMSVLQSQVEVYPADRPKSVIDLQQFRTDHSIAVEMPDGGKSKITLINLNPQVNRWYLLQVSQENHGAPQEYHLVNPFPRRQQVILDDRSPNGLILAEDSKAAFCPLWKPLSGGVLDAARHMQQAYVPLCEGRLYLRNPVKGHRTAIEAVTDFLRDRLPGGDSIVGFVRDTFFQDAYREEARTVTGSEAEAPLRPPQSPAPAEIDSDYSGRLVAPADLGIPLETPVKGMLPGRWYAARGNPGIFVSLMQPAAVAPEILRSYTGIVRNLDSVEAKALDYLVAFDLQRFDLGFAVGTEHPRVDWSERILPQMKEPNLPGPDGIDSIAPLVATGMVNPVEVARTVATFTGGFKRIHGAFRYGQLAYRNHGSHYGFIEGGVVFSKLQPGLATLLVLNDGTVEMKTWTEQDDSDLARIAYARQNGVPIIEFDPVAQKPAPGRLVGLWGEGNWSGSKDLKLRTLRAGVALQTTDRTRFLIYGYFSTATPSAMARVFQAYGCRYAMHLDMNALEHTYLAVYHREGSRLVVEHLIQGMSVLDKTVEGVYIPRFLGYADDRDFFYIMQKQSPKEAS
jgi:hypothetical protein